METNYWDKKAFDYDNHMKKNKVTKKLVKHTASQYDKYMNKFQPKATCQCHVIDARSIKPISSDFSLLKIFKILGAIFQIRKVNNRGN